MRLTLYTSPYCSCSSADLDALRVLMAGQADVQFHIEFHIVDITQALEQAARAGVRRTPTLVLDDEVLPPGLISDRAALWHLIEQRAGSAP
jgi:glutaredoxin